MIQAARSLILRSCVLLALSVPGVAHAAANPVPLQGIWSSPDCAAASHIRILSKYFMIETTGQRLSITTSRTWQHDTIDGEDFYQVQSDFFSPLLINRTNDGLMKTLPLPAGDTRSQNQIWSQTPHAQVTEYSHCAKLFDSHPALNQIEVNSIFLLDSIKDECDGVRAETFPGAASCHQAMFNVLDTDQSGGLNAAELGALYQQTAFLNTGLGVCATGAAYPGEVARQGRDFAAALIRENGQRDVQFSDAQGLIDTASPALKPFIDSVRALNPLLNFMSAPVAATTACPVNNIGANKTGAVPVVEGPLNIQWQAPRYVGPAEPSGD